MQKLLLPLFLILLVAGFNADLHAQYEKEPIEKFRVVPEFEMPQSPGLVGADSDSVVQVRPHTVTFVSPEDYGVTIQADTALFRMIALDTRINQEKEKAPGFRIQIYAGSGLESANEAKTDFLISFGNDRIPVYQTWNPPHFRVRVGDFLSRSDAMREISRIREVFPDAFIVSDQVKLPKYRKAVPTPNQEEPEIHGMNGSRSDGN